MHTSVQVSATKDMEKIDSMLLKENFDLLHFHEPWIPVLSRQILLRSNAVNVATFHAKVPETLMSRTVIRVVTPYLKSVMKYLHVLTAVSDSGAEYAASMSDEPIKLIPNGIDLAKYKHKPVEHDKETKTILYIGRLERRKGVRYLLKAFQLLSQKMPEARLIIAGDGPDREKLELLADDLKLTNISFLGYISEELKLELLAEADIFCSPAVYGESFGIVLLEAMATGTVCVAGNNSGYSDLMEGVGALSIVDPHFSDEFARRLYILLSEPKLQALWKSWAKEHIKQFTYPKVVDQYEAMYKESLELYGPKKS
jgi:phosphatidylinositol alpha-mannosyltransferase